MKLHENPPLFRQAVQFTAQQMGILDIYVEKDYWVTFALHTIFHHNIGKETVFKGGTALSKCFGLIERFSEDIDLVVLRREGETHNQLTNKLKKVSAVVSAAMPEINMPEVTQKMGMIRKTAHTYSREFQGNFGQIRDVIIVEATWLGYFEPYVTKTVSSLIFTMMVNNGQEAIAQEYDLLPFEVLALDPTRTLCEKIMSLVRFSYSDVPIDDLKNKIRHIYDLHQLLQKPELSGFFDSAAFAAMLLKVANDDIASFKNNNEWLVYHPKQARIFAELDSVWAQLIPTYQGVFKHLVFGVLPKESDVLATLVRIKARLASVTWTITIDKK